MSRPASRAGAAATALVSAAVTAGVLRLLDARTGESWRRRNYRGSEVTLSAGPAVAAGLLSGLTLCRGRIASAAAVAVTGAAAAGFYDDRASRHESERRVKGFAGHIGALAKGNASAGTVKLVVVGASSVAAGFVRTGASVDTVIDGCLVAGSANLCNLLDLRPGRALKVATLLAAASTPFPGGGGLLAASCGAIGAALPGDLGERSMLGDTGANALGAMLGSVQCSRTRRARLLALMIVVGLTALSERISFTAVIGANPVLRRLDELGRAGD